MHPSRRMVMGIMDRHRPPCQHTTILPGGRMKSISRMAVGKDNVNGTGSKPKMNCATNERREVAMTSTPSMGDLLG